MFVNESRSHEIIDCPDLHPRVSRPHDADLQLRPPTRKAIALAFQSVPLLLGLVGEVRRTAQGVKLKHSSELRPTEHLPSRFRFPRVSSEMSDPDRRRAQRITLQQFVSLVIGNDGHEVPAIIENLSSAGVLLYADHLIQESSEIGLILVVPPVETEAEGKRMWCFGEVLRVEKELKEGKFGMAIGFQRCQVLSQA